MILVIDNTAGVRTKLMQLDLIVSTTVVNYNYNDERFHQQCMEAREIKERAVKASRVISRNLEPKQPRAPQVPYNIRHALAPLPRSNC